MLLRCMTVVFLFLALPCTALAATEIEISSPGEQSIPLGLTKLLPDEGTRSTRIAAEFDEVLGADLDLSGLFRFVDPQSFLDDAGHIGLFSTQVNFPQWRLLGAETLIKGTYHLDGDKLVVEGRLFDVVNRRLLTGRRYVGQAKDVRRMAHAFADLVLKALTGEEGPFSSRIAYISNQTGDKELWLMDVDGKRPLRLTNHRSIVLNPDFSPRGKEILFTSYRANNPDLYRKEIYTGKEARLSYKPGLNIAGRMSPDEREIALTLSKDGNPDIFILDVARRSLRPIARHGAIDTEPAWAPDGKSLVFTSDRGGRPQIYRYDLRSGLWWSDADGEKKCAEVEAIAAIARDLGGTVSADLARIMSTRGAAIDTIAQANLRGLPALVAIGAPAGKTPIVGSFCAWHGTYLGEP